MNGFSDMVRNRQNKDRLVAMFLENKRRMARLQAGIDRLAVDAAAIRSEAGAFLRENGDEYSTFAAKVGSPMKE